MSDALPAPSCAAEADALIAAGKTLATTADPDKDLLAFASDFRELAWTLRSLGTGLDSAYEGAEGLYDARLDALDQGKLWHVSTGRAWTRDEVALARDNEMKQARRTAARTAQKALVELSRLIRELQWEAK